MKDGTESTVMKKFAELGVMKNNQNSRLRISII